MGICVISEISFLYLITTSPSSSSNQVPFATLYPSIFSPSTSTLSKLPEDKFINSLLAKRLKVGVYTLPDKSWLDFGQWDSFDSSAKLMSEI